MYQPVAKTLAIEALKGGPAADAFGRSAFNRYYYSAYLSTRNFLNQFDSKWGSQSHANIPDTIEVNLIKLINASAEKARRTGLISDSDKERIKSLAKTTARMYASLLREAYDTRCTADYQPETKLEFNEKGFSITGTTNSTAERWLIEVNQKKGTLMGLCKELGIA
ncbi:MAG: hypothetical protein U1D25_06020 [Hydrogenophaga sp.]|uniref:hypothetical protein n=1 Tax=Hydrogenophaga sp. TaxID=1904254 RepID=UPI002ABBB152|nr:hypothetical protein [Hydrogenophaga sp.]MDZ4187650.1 hypothetical protein [Hydrogenophaga sp.]